MMHIETQTHAFGLKAAIWTCGFRTVPTAPSSEDEAFARGREIPSTTVGSRLTASSC